MTSAKFIDDKRYAQTDRGVYSIYGHYYYEQSHWDAMVAEGRSPYADHDFDYDGPSSPDDVDPILISQWGWKHVTCRKCGETRDVGAPLSQVNAGGWCLEPKVSEWLPASIVVGAVILVLIVLGIVGVGMLHR